MQSDEAADDTRTNGKNIATFANNQEKHYLCAIVATVYWPLNEAHRPISFI